MVKDFYILRRAQGLSQKKMADKLGCTQQTVSSWENGNSDPPIKTFPKIAALLDITEHELYDILMEKYKDKS